MSNLESFVSRCQDLKELVEWYKKRNENGFYDDMISQIDDLTKRAVERRKITQSEDDSLSFLESIVDSWLDY